MDIRTKIAFSVARCVKCLRDYGTAACTPNRETDGPPACVRCKSSGHTVNYLDKNGGEDQSEIENRGGRYGTTANRCTKRMYRSCVKNAKCMTTPPRLKYMELVCAVGCAIYKLQWNYFIRRGSVASFALWRMVMLAQPITVLVLISVLEISSNYSISGPVVAGRLCASAVASRAFDTVPLAAGGDH
ncbi:hypothetical protein EVAR_51712_1 [Eumeta japonica]|uniref:Uncharacterized protein n=1 Tax=Eumeta variegata TaxID=151549 RepID=A0A4C1XI40_EUMVA|nr:hypothetical protein EVAR_51712_1 [Eumeta japonica]